ncbi:MAG: hypothetical protein Q9216_004367 [Gyalolechia sp. 2 TL-2023]
MGQVLRRNGSATGVKVDWQDLNNTFSSTSRQNDAPPNTKPESPSQNEPISPHLLDTFQNSTFTATQHLNTLTGYTGIESLKASIESQEAHLQHTRSALASARTAYTSAINNRSASQREVNSLLQRKHAWSPADLERFTELYRSDHANELQETQAHATLIQAEKEAEDAGAKLSESILRRYHEEQIWSDKIRRMSTWGTWGLMGVNVLLFLVFQLGLEPWRRGRLVRGFEEKVREALEEERSIDLRANVTGNGKEDARVDWEAGVKQDVDGVVRERVVERGGSVGGDEGNEVETTIEREMDGEVAESNEAERQIDRAVDEEILSERGQMMVLKDKFKDLFSDQEVVVRRWDLTALALEGAAAGVTVAGIMVLLWRPR